MLVMSMVIPVSAESYLPTLTISNTEIPEVNAGTNITVPIEINNNSNFLAKQIEVKPVLEEGSPFMVEELVVKKEISLLSPKKKETVEFNFKVDKNTKAGVYPINLKIDYKNSQKQPFNQSEIIYIKVVSEHLPVEVIMKDVTYDKDPQSGESFDMFVELKNTGSIAAENVFISLTSNENFLVTGNVTEQFILKLPGMATEKVKYTLTAKDDLEAGQYPIKCSVKYIDNYDESKTKEFELFIPVGGTTNAGKAKVGIENLTSPNQVKENQEFKINFDLVNSGEGKATDLQVTAESEGEELVPVSLNKQIIGTMEPGVKESLSFAFQPTSGSKTKNYPIKLTITYKQGKEELSFSRYVGVNVLGKSTTSGTVPLMIVSDYAADPKIVNAGEEFDLSLTLWNTNKEKAVSNMKVTLAVKENSEDTKDDVFTPVDGSNTLYVASLAPGEKTTQHLRFFTVPDAKARNYKIDVNFEYEYDNNNEVSKGTSVDQIGIQVVQPAEIQVVNFNIDEAPQFMGDKGYIYISCNNIGNVKVKNLQATISGDLGEETIFQGDLESGNSHEFRFKLRPQEMGTMNEKILVSYKDTRGETHEHEETFTLEIMEPMEQPGFDDMMYDENAMGELDNPQGAKSKTPWIVGGVALAVVILVIVIIIRKRRKKKELMFDEAL